MSKRVPKYRHHKATGQAVVTLGGRDHYLGKHGTPESHVKYAAAISAWQMQQTDAPKDLKVRQLTVLYWQYAQRYYVKDGEPTGHLHIVKNGLKYLNEDCRDLLVAEFGPKRLAQLRDKLIKLGHSRKYINDLISVVKRMYRWALEEELVCGSPNIQSVLTRGVGWVKKGRTEAREPERVKPVPEMFVDAIREHVRPQVWAMIELQRWTGMRPGEVRIMRVCDLDTSGTVWLYRPQRHKAEHHDAERVICIGTHGQEVLKCWLKTNAQAYLFSSDKSGNRPYRRDSYRTAIVRACAKAEVPMWSPNQLRHNFATRARKEFGIEAARVALGHTSTVVTEIYAERDMEAAKAVIAKIG